MKISAKTLPSGWHWVAWDDGYGHLASPSGTAYFLYDRLPYCTMNCIEYVDIFDDRNGWCIFYGELSEFKTYAESVVMNKIYMYVDDDVREIGVDSI